MAQYKFSNSKQLMNGVGAYIEKALNQVAIEVLNELKHNVQSRIYDFEPYQYDRTYQVIKSISKTAVKKSSNGMYEAIIYFDSMLIEPIIYSGGTWNAHADFLGNEVDGNDIIKWLDGGTNNKFYSHIKTDFWKDTIEWVNREYSRMFKQKIQVMGITTS